MVVNATRVLSGSPRRLTKLRVCNIMVRGTHSGVNLGCMDATVYKMVIIHRASIANSYLSKIYHTFSNVYQIGSSNPTPLNPQRPVT